MTFTLPPLTLAHQQHCTDIFVSPHPLASRCSTRRQQDKSMIDSDKPPNNLAHWFLSDKTVSFIPHHHMSRTLQTLWCFLPAAPLWVTHRGPRPHANTGHLSCLYHVFVRFYGFKFYFLIVPNLKGLCHILISGCSHLNPNLPDIELRVYFGLIKDKTTNVNKMWNLSKINVCHSATASDVSFRSANVGNFWKTDHYNSQEPKVTYLNCFLFILKDIGQEKHNILTVKKL